MLSLHFILKALHDDDSTLLPGIAIAFLLIRELILHSRQRRHRHNREKVQGDPVLKLCQMYVLLAGGFQC